MEIIATILRLIFGIIEVYLLLNCIYILFFAFAGLINKDAQPVDVQRRRKFCILIPAYKEDVVIIEVGLNAVRHQYGGPSDVYVIADGLKDETIATLKSHHVRVIPVSFEKSTKAKALVSALGQLPEEGYEIALILDADNIMDVGFLEKVNAAFDAGALSVQAHRVAKNYDSTFALLDACNEEINNHLLRKGHYNIGLGSALIGSGMAFDFSEFKRLLNGLDKVMAEDKELDIRVAKDRIKTVYLKDAYVFDEKINNAEVFTKQRSRWIFSQIECLRTNFSEGVRQLFKYGNIDLFDKIIQLIILPRTLLLGALFLMLLQAFINPFSFSPLFNGVMLVMAAAALLLSLPRKFYNARLWKAIITMPAVIFYMVKALLIAGRVKKGWTHTPHTTTHTEIK
jgi:cellulose synthase/poly-beta-1,6-N-acetylglucosamine synthase-like glycosyltransferase